MFLTFGFILWTLGSVPSNVFTADLGTLNTFDGTEQGKTQGLEHVFFLCGSID